MTAISKDFRINDAIRAREVRLVDHDGGQLGIVSLRDALRMAGERGMDLVEVAPTARPAVCRILDYGKFKYETSKRERDARRKQKVVEIKEVKMRPNIEEHDFDVKSRNAERFLTDGDKVRATIMFRGREIVHAALARQLLDRLAERVQNLAVVERNPKVEGRNMIMILTPRPEVSRAAQENTTKMHKERQRPAQASDSEAVPDGH